MFGLLFRFVDDTDVVTDTLNKMLRVKLSITIFVYNMYTLVLN